MDRDDGGRAVVGEDDNDEKRRIRRDEAIKLGGTARMELARGSSADQQAHDQPQIVAGEVDQIAGKSEPA